jgi:hypothetical protein
MEVTHEQTGTLRAQTHGHEPIVLENHPADSRVKISTDGMVQTLSSRMGTGGGNTPIVLENHPMDSRMKIKEDGIFQTMGVRGGQEYEPHTLMVLVENRSEEYARTQNPILRLLSETYGAQAVEEWGIAILATLQQADVLQQGVYESSVQSKAQEGYKLDDSTLPCEELVAGWLLRDMRKQSECGCSPQGRKSTEQLNREFAEVMQKLSHKGSSSTKALFDMWSKGEGLGILQQTLHQIQEIRQSFNGEWKGGDLMDSVSAVVRRLTPL